MKKAGLVVDNFKLKAFRKNLENAGFDWTETKFTETTTTMFVEYHPKDFEALHNVVYESNAQAKGKK